MRTRRCRWLATIDEDLPAQKPLEGSVVEVDQAGNSFPGRQQQLRSREIRGEALSLRYRGDDRGTNQTKPGRNRRNTWILGADPSRRYPDNSRGFDQSLCGPT
jgi:hypothetical protein